MFLYVARIICILTSIAYFAGNLVYSILSLFPEGSRYWILMVARFAIGVSSGTKRIENKAKIIKAGRLASPVTLLPGGWL